MHPTTPRHVALPLDSVTPQTPTKKGWGLPATAVARLTPGQASGDALLAAGKLTTFADMLSFAYVAG
jgi:hypothetical protein